MPKFVVTAQDKIKRIKEVCTKLKNQKELKSNTPLMMVVEIIMAIISGDENRRES